jgi:AraC-like DNA-binding protein
MAKFLSNKIFYPSIHEIDKKFGLVVTTSGFQVIASGQQYPPEGHPKTHSYNYHKGRTLNEFQLVYITHGKGTFRSNQNEEINLSGGTIFILFPGIWHTYHPDSVTGWEAYWVGFSGLFADRLIENSFLNPDNPLFEIGYNEPVVKLFQEINEHAKREEPGSQALLAGIVIHLIGVLLHFKRNEVFSNKTYIPLINKAKVIMREHVSTPITAEEIARKLNISYSWFRRTFKEYTGFSPTQFIMDLTIQKAKELLVQTDDSVKQIAIQLNFDSTDYFSVFFKRATGYNPLSYRALRSVHL